MKPFPACLLVFLCASVHAQSIFTVAGGGTDDGRPATVAAIYPRAVAVDSSGNLYITDSATFRIRKVTAATGVIATVAGTGTSGFSGDEGPATAASLSDPNAIALDGSGNLYIADSANERIRKVSAATGIIMTVAGKQGFGFSGDGGPATAALLSRPEGVVVDAAGNLYIADTANNRIRRVAGATGIITTVSGSGVASFFGDAGPATAAALFFPTGLAVDRSGNFYIVDSGNNRIRKVAIATGIITTVAGNGIRGFSGDGGPATAASLNFVVGGGGVWVDASGNLYIADYGNHRIRKVNASTGIITTVAGGGTPGFSGDGGPATTAALRFPAGVALDGPGNLYIADSDNVRVRKVSVATGIITTVVGTDFFAVSGDGGPGTAARVTGVGGVALDSSGDLYFAEPGAHRIRKVSSSTGIITTVAGNGVPGFTGDGGFATAASLYSPNDVALDGAGNLYIADFSNFRIRKVSAATGIITTVAGSGTFGFSGDGGPASAASLYYPRGIALDGSGNLYIADTSNHRIRRVTAASGIIRTIAGNGVGDFLGDGGPATATSLWNPFDVALDGSGNVYIADTSSDRIRKVNAATGIITTVAGSDHFAEFAGDGGPATAAALFQPETLALDATGNMYIADTSNLRVRKVTVATGIIRTVVGGGKAFGDAGPATATTLRPWGMGLDAAGNLYMTDGLTNRVRAVFACVEVSSPTLISPAGNSTGVSTSPRLAWNSVRGAFRYDVVLDIVSPPKKVAASDIATTTFSPSNLEPLTTYYWQVVAKGDPFCVPFSTNVSEVRSFTTAAGCTAPGSFGAVSPTGR